MSCLRLLQAKATNLPNVEKVGKSDPYASFQFQGISRLYRFLLTSLHSEELA